MVDNRNTDEGLKRSRSEIEKQERKRLWVEMRAHWRGDMGPAYVVVNEIEYLFKP